MAMQGNDPAKLRQDAVALDKMAFAMAAAAAAAAAMAATMAFCPHIAGAWAAKAKALFEGAAAAAAAAMAARKKASQQEAASLASGFQMPSFSMPPTGLPNGGASGDPGQGSMPGGGLPGRGLPSQNTQEGPGNAFGPPPGTIGGDIVPNIQSGFLSDNLTPAGGDSKQSETINRTELGLSGSKAAGKFAFGIGVFGAGIAGVMANRRQSQSKDGMEDSRAGGTAEVNRLDGPA